MKHLSSPQSHDEAVILEPASSSFDRSPSSRPLSFLESFGDTPSGTNPPPSFHFAPSSSSSGTTAGGGVNAIEPAGSSSQKDFPEQQRQELQVPEPVLPPNAANSRNLEFDEYGFLILPDTARYEEEEAVRKDLESQNEGKWDQVLNEFESYRTKKIKKLKRLVLNGVPSNRRLSLWLKCASDPKISDAKYKAQYEYLVRCPIPESESRAIRLDAPRAFRNNRFFHTFENNNPQPTGDTARVTELSRILHAYTALDPSVGYMSGMQFVASVALIVSGDEEIAFRIFCFVMQRLKWREYYLNFRPLFVESVAILEALMKAFLPELCRRFNQEGIDVGILTPHWLLTVFSSSLPFNTLLGVWDCLFVFGHDFIFACVLAVLRCFQERLLGQNGYDLLEIVTVIGWKTEIPPHVFVPESVRYLKALNQVPKLRRQFIREQAKVAAMNRSRVTLPLV
eukprot:c2712_g1_i1.p1 GENE.c2712_g1_i1~~c2712_g1_i1.p1  ORF type:complete len:453 (+),score=107.17 c2712_g1_i1:88-1446(+)